MDCPHQRLARLGPGALTDAELLSLVFENTKPREEWLDRCGGFRGLALLPWDQLCQLPELGGTEGAARFTAAVELGRRALRSAERRPRLATPSEVFRYLQPELATLRREVFHVLSFDVRQTLLSDVRVAVGAVDHCVLDPREVYAAALAARANGVILAHNHPSGSPEPSADDWCLNAQLQTGLELLGIRLIDHLVVGDRDFTALMRAGHQMKTTALGHQSARPPARRRNIAKPSD